MRQDVAPVDAPELPVDPAGIGQLALERGEDAVPQPLTRPAPLARGNRRPWPEARGQATPCADASLSLFPLAQSASDYPLRGADLRSRFRHRVPR
jgi:hypothetical protein